MDIRQPQNNRMDSTYAALLIDMQDPCIAEIGVQERERLMRSQTEVLRYCGKNDIPVFVVEFDFAGPTRKELRQELPDVKWYPIFKKDSNAFENTGLDQYLAGFSVKNIFLMGVHADKCVRSTAGFAVDNGYGIATAESVIATDGGQKSLEDSLGWYNRNGILVRDHSEMFTN
jgi:nicotinamidase-related amidase